MIKSSDILIAIPTYNESENIRNLYNQINELSFSKDFLFVDDNSPDGTGKIIQEIQIENENVFAYFRPSKMGIGSAHQDIIKFAYEKEYKILITMDCDFTHSPKSIIDFIDASSNFDIVVGSRYLKKDSLKDWNLLRKFLTNLGHFLTKYILNLKEDATGAFRLYKLENIPSSLFSLVQSKGYSFFFESLFIISYNNFKINEIGIDLPTRTYGTSKMEINDVIKSLKYLYILLVRKFIYKNTLKIK
ncbi:MAG: glycosyltransferase [Bacteroidetes bacterium]|nr:MAG: glycosyltransferase [Bacteroidota bacterium]